MKRIFGASLFFLLFFAANARSAMLTGEVSFNDITDLYTYTYTLDTTGYTGNIAIINIQQNKWQDFSGPFPVSTTQPFGWNFELSSGFLGNNVFEDPANIEVAGTFWGWSKNGQTQDFADIQTFSFTTERGISTSTASNYGLFETGSFTPGLPTTGYNEIGNIVGPALIAQGVPFEVLSPVPENETYAMMVAGLGLIGFVARRRNKAK